MKTQFKFDHTYSMNFPESDYKKLKEFGFSTMDNHVVEHPGSTFCRFILFERFTPYLEFVEIKDMKIYEKYLKDQNKLQEEELVPGVSLAIDGSLKELWEKKKDSFQEFGIHFEHKNYNWKENSNDYLPGWNFVTFNKPLIDESYIWITEYEKNPDDEHIKKKYQGCVHKNTVTNIIGTYWIFNDMKNLNPFLELIEGTLIDGRVEFSNETFMQIDFADKETELVKYYNKNKPYPQKAVIVECKSMDEFKKVSGINETISFLGTDACIISLNSTALDIIVVEECSSKDPSVV